MTDVADAEWWIELDRLRYDLGVGVRCHGLVFDVVSSDYAERALAPIS